MRQDLEDAIPERGLENWDMGGNMYVVERTACGLPKGEPFAIEDLLAMIRPNDSQVSLHMSFNGIHDTRQESSKNGGIDAAIRAIDVLVQRHAPQQFAKFASSSVNSADVRRGSASDAQVVVRVDDLENPDAPPEIGTFVHHDSVIATAQAYVSVLNRLYKKRYHR